MKKKLSDVLLERGLISRNQLESALSHQSTRGWRQLGAALVEMGVLSEGSLVRELSQALQIPMTDLSRVIPDADAVSSLPAHLCEEHDVFPVALTRHPDGKNLLLAMADPLDEAVLDEITFITDADVTPVVAQRSSIKAAILLHHRGEACAIPPLAPDAFRIPPPREDPRGFDEPTMVDRSKPMSDGFPPVVVGVSLVDPTGVAAANPIAHQPAGSFAVVQSAEGEPILEPTALERELRPVDMHAVDGLERNFWTLMRHLLRRGAITREEFLAELAAAVQHSTRG